MSKSEAHAFLNERHPPFYANGSYANPVTCDIFLLYSYITSTSNYTFAGKNKDAIIEYKKIFNARVISGETLPLFDLDEKD